MEAALFAKMMSDKSVTDLKKLGYKYPQADIAEFIGLLKTGFYTTLPMKDFNGEPLVYLESVAQVHLSAAKILLTPHNSSQHYGIKAMEDEIVSTLTIEQIDTSRENLHQLYEMTVGDFLAGEDRLLPGNYYRHDSVYVVGDKVEHMGLPWKKLPEYMADLI